MSQRSGACNRKKKRSTRFDGSRLVAEASQKLGISRDQINKTLTFVHFQKHYGAVEGSRQTWEQIPDWTDEGNLPDWVKRGESA